MVGLLRRGKKRDSWPGFCETCGSPRTAIEVRPKSNPYRRKDGSLITTKVFACSNDACARGKVRGEFPVVVGQNGWGAVSDPFVWIGIPVETGR